MGKWWTSAARLPDAMMTGKARSHPRFFASYWKKAAISVSVLPRVNCFIPFWKMASEIL